MDNKADNTELWRMMLSGTDPTLLRARHLFRLIPAAPRCNTCYAPFHGLGGPVMRVLGRGPSRYSPRFCQACERFVESHPGGCELELSLVFADVRGSTTLAEAMQPSSFTRLMNQFFAAATDILVETDALIDKLVGDEIIGLYSPGFVGPDHAGVAIRAAERILRSAAEIEVQGRKLEVGAAVHTGLAYVGSVGKGTTSGLTAMGDTVNTAARLVAQAPAGTVLISAAAYQAAKLEGPELERRSLQLKGKSEPVDVYVKPVSTVAHSSE